MARMFSVSTVTSEMDFTVQENIYVNDHIVHL